MVAQGHYSEGVSQMSVTTIEFLDHYNTKTEQYEAVELPAKYVVCDACQGRGKSSAYLGVFTRDDIDEMGDEWMDDYMAGHYDKPCDFCKGERVVAVVDEDECDPILLAEYNEQKQIEIEDRMNREAERRMGA